MTNIILDEPTQNQDTIRELSAIYATRGERLGAFVIDSIVINFILLIADIFLDFKGPIMGVVTFMSFPIYKIVTEGGWSRTVGKLFLNLQVVKDASALPRINFLTANIRFLLNWPLYLAFSLYVLFPKETSNTTTELLLAGGLIIGIICFFLANGTILFDRHNRTWSDKLGKTSCIHKGRVQKHLKAIK
ncbi:MAG: RDD family protein [Aureispira sp.]